MTILLEKQIEFMRKLMVLLAWIYSHKGWGVRGGHIYRTKEQQKIYFDQGLSQTMNSKHLRSLAVDLIFFKDGILQKDPEAYRPLGEFWENELGGRWGGRFGVKKENYDKEVGWDSQHFEVY